MVIGDFTLNMSSTSLCARWNGNPALEFGLVRQMFIMLCKPDNLILSLIVFVNSAIFVGFMMLVEEDGWARGGVRARGMVRAPKSLLRSPTAAVTRSG